MNISKNDNLELKSTMDIINVPIKINSNQIKKIDEGYEIKLTNKIDSKKIVAKRVESKKIFFYLDIRDDEVTILNRTKNYYESNDVVDFIIPGNSEFYHNFLQKLLHFNEDFLEDQFEFPPHYPAIVQKNTTFKYPTFKTQLHIPKNFAIKIRYEDKIPDKPPQNLTEKILKYTRNFADSDKTETMSDIVNILKEFYNERPIYKYSELQEKIDNNKVLAKYSNYKVKLHISLVAYFYKSGPWKNRWIKYGYDPKIHQSSYIYQVLPLRLQKKNFNIYSSKKLVQIIENNKEIYLKQKPDSTNGFLTSKFMDFVQIYVKNPINLESIKIENDEEDECFEVFD